MTDLRLTYESMIDKKVEHIGVLQDENARMRDELRGKDEAIQALSSTLIEKGEKNKKLTESIAEMKNH